ncbi:response regulator [Acinetobacter sp. VNH17]|uniref:Response regulator n=1 Tax=Acinetobacter thutiue TaxID=2998078 RepID=A0ABT7WTF5_9GAMM|nr:response regulator [Acinetobacter thutiue]MCY6413846.1 response regulator [Acinetobacter thutiue]MDN0015955.1 response regulator [Acinetobacter thutiue]
MHILVVEDSLETRQWLQTVIVDAFPDARIKAANSVKEGLSICLDQQFQIALIDLGLPDGSGIEVLSYLRQRHPDTQCVVMSVLGDDLHIVNALAGGGGGLLSQGTTQGIDYSSTKAVTFRNPCIISLNCPPFDGSFPVHPICGHHRA